MREGITNLSSKLRFQAIKRNLQLIYVTEELGLLLLNAPPAIVAKLVCFLSGAGQVVLIYHSLFCFFFFAVTVKDAYESSESE